jgi:AraC-like DNA-binding protein
MYILLMLRSLNGCLRTQKIYVLSPLIFLCGFAAIADTTSASDSARITAVKIDTVRTAKDTCAPAAAGVKNDTLHSARTPFFLTIDVQKPLRPVPSNKEIVKPHAAFKLRGAARFGVLLLSILLIGAVVWFVVKKNSQPAFLSTTRLSVMDKEVQKTCKYIEKNHAKTDLSVDMICSDLVTGKAFLEALFEKELGLTVDRFITYVRINRARIFIENNLYADAETVGRESGFAALEMFTAAFKKIVGTSFEDYRELRARQEAKNG